MPEEFITKHFENAKFHSKRNPVFMNDCYDENCELKGDFSEYIILNYDNIVKILKKHGEKSVDRIVFAKKLPNKKVNVLLCELTTGKKKYSDVLKKMVQSGEYIINILETYGFNVINFDCIYLGRYQEEKRIRKTNRFTIPGCSRNDLKIRKFPCGTDIKDIERLNLIN